MNPIDWITGRILWWQLNRNHFPTPCPRCRRRDAMRALQAPRRFECQWCGCSWLVRLRTP